MGACCAEFTTKPPHGAIYGINNRLVNVEGEEPETEFYYECREHPMVQEAYFLNSNNWMIPINTSELSGLQCRNLPQGISVFGAVYRLGGFSVHVPGHYSGVIRWHLYYDGLGATKEQRLQCLKTKNIQHKTGFMLIIFFVIDLLFLHLLYKVYSHLHIFHISQSGPHSLCPWLT